MTSYFDDKTFKFSQKAIEISTEICQLLKPIYDREAKAGNNIRELSGLISSTMHMVESDIATHLQMDAYKQEILDLATEAEEKLNSMPKDTDLGEHFSRERILDAITALRSYPINSKAKSLLTLFLKSKHADS